MSRPASCVIEQRACTCEAVRTDSWVQQPLCAYSSLVLVVIALSGLAKSIRSSVARSGRVSWNLLLIFTGLGSFFFHARLEYWAENWDFGSIYGITSILAVQVFRTSRTPHRFTGMQAALIASAFAGAGMAFKLWVPALRGALAGVAVVLCGGVILRYRKTFSEVFQRKLSQGLIFASVGGICFGLDYLPGFCGPMHWFQWHVAWHLFLTAALVSVGSETLGERRP